MRMIGELVQLEVQTEADKAALPDQVHLIEMPNSLPENVPLSCCIAVVQDANPMSVVNTALETGLGHVIQQNGDDFWKEVDTASRLILNPETLFADPVQSVFYRRDLGVREGTRKTLILDINDRKDKKNLIREIGAFLSSIPLTETIHDSVIAIADELFTNAVFHGNRCVQNPDGPPPKDPHPIGRMIVSCEGDRLVVGCQDYYGSLSKSRVLSRLLECYGKGVSATINRGKGGAGIGFKMIFDLCMSLYVGVSAGKSTLICCVLPLGQSFKNNEAMLKNLHWVTTK